MKKNLICLVIGAVAGVAMTLAAASIIPVPAEDGEDLDDFFALDGCK